MREPLLKEKAVSFRRIVERTPLKQSLNNSKVNFHAWKTWCCAGWSECVGKCAGLRPTAGNFVQTGPKLQISSGRSRPPLFPYLRLNTFQSVVNRPGRGEEMGGKTRGCRGVGGEGGQQQQWEGKASCCCCWLRRKSLFPTAIRT